MISPTAIYAILLLAAPLAMIFVYSFWTDGYLTIIREFQLCNYYGPCASYKEVDGVLQPTQEYLGAWSDPLTRTLMLRSAKCVTGGDNGHCGFGVSCRVFCQLLCGTFGKVAVAVSDHYSVLDLCI